MASQEEEAKNRRNTKLLTLAHLSLLRELAMDSRHLLAIAIIFLAIAIIFATLIGAWMFRYESVGSGLVTHRNRFTGAVCRIEEDCWFRSY